MNVLDLLLVTKCNRVPLCLCLKGRALRQELNILMFEFARFLRGAASFLRHLGVVQHLGPFLGSLL